MRTQVLVGPHQGSRAPGTQALCTMSHPSLTSFPWSNFPPHRKELDGLFPWTHRPVHPAEVFSPLLLQSRTTRRCFLPWQGKGAESSFLCPLPPRSVSEIGVSNLLFPSRKQSPPSPSHRTELGEGLAAFLSTTCPSSSSSCWDPWMYPPPILYCPRVCVRACVCMCRS